MQAKPTAGRGRRSHHQQSRSLLDAVHREPAVQEGAAHAGRAPRACTTAPPTAGRCSTAPPACGAATPATAGRRSSRRSPGRRRSSTTRRPSRWATRRSSSSPPASSPTCRPASTTSSSPTPARSRSRPALKIALAYQRASGQGTRFRLIGRERGYHGVNFGGISVGGIVTNRKQFGTLLTGVDHIRHTHDLARNAFTRGQPEHGAELADDLERLVALHDASTIAAVIVEPVAGSTGVLIPPKGYLEKLRAICDKHGILLIFDEVITGFGRLGAPFAVDYFGVTPDIVLTAKGLTNGVIPMGAVFVKKEIYDAFMTGPEHMIELFHGYTYSGNPVASRRRPRHARHLRGGGAAHPRRRARRLLGGRAPFAEGPAARHRRPQSRPGRRGRARADRRRSRPSAPSPPSSRPSRRAS